MKAQVQVVALPALVCLSLLAAFSVSGAQGPVLSVSFDDPSLAIPERTAPPPEAQMASLRSEALDPRVLAARPAIIAQEEPPMPNVEYFAVETETLDNGTLIGRVTINGPPTPPPGFERTAVELSEASPQTGLVILSGVPAYDWSYGCSATSAAMIAAYYDRTLYPNVYTGPSNGGVMPMDNGMWGHTTWPRCDEPGTSSVGECPLSATHNGIDGRSTRGHVDDYWIGYGCPGPDPYVTNAWTEHALGDCTGDYMKTNKWFSTYSLNSDGATQFYFYISGAPTPASDLAAAGPPQSYDGGVGIELFFESRGYAVTNVYNQLIRGRGSNPSQGFSYDQYKAEIDAGRPVMIHVEGHTMVGVGYDDTSSDLMYIHDTWDYDTHTMTWGDSYTGMPHHMVTVVQLEPPSIPAPTLTSITPSSGLNTGIVHITNLAGSNFRAGASVKLARAGQPDINATNVSVVNSSWITCDFDLVGAATGSWDVVVTNPDAQSHTLPNSFMVRVPGVLHHSVYLPLVLRRRPPIPETPVLNPIDNSDGDGAYDVTWSASSGATSYVLEEATNPSFAGATPAYSGAGTSTPISGKVPGTYSYRVKAINLWGSSGWSHAQSVTVGPSGPTGVINGDFEDGPTGWTEYSKHGWDLIVTEFPKGVTPHSGSWAVWLGGEYNDISFVQQQVTVPPGSPYLAYWHWVASADVCGFDFGGVIVNGSEVVDQYNLCESENTGGWVRHTVNLNAYAGQSISLQIRVETDESRNSNLFVDDVSFQASASPTENGSDLFDPEDAVPKPSAGVTQGLDTRGPATPQFFFR